MRRNVIAGLAGFALLSLTACSGGEPESESAATMNDESGTLAAAVTGAAGMTTLANGLKTSGLASVFDGTAPYTILAPNDDAFGALGEAGAALKLPEQSAAMAAILREHVVPGYFATADIEAALTAAKGKPVKMRTMGDGEVTFTRTGETITVTADDGSSAKLAGEPMRASNGVALPIDGVLKKLPAA